MGTSHRLPKSVSEQQPNKQPHKILQNLRREVMAEKKKKKEVCLANGGDGGDRDEL
jgi:hypothetical protein